MQLSPVVFSTIWAALHAVGNRLANTPNDFVKVALWAGKFYRELLCVSVMI
jgi:hypothetical protein